MAKLCEFPLLKPKTAYQLVEGPKPGSQLQDWNISWFRVESNVMLCTADDLNELCFIFANVTVLITIVGGSQRSPVIARLTHPVCEPAESRFLTNIPASSWRQAETGTESLVATGVPTLAGNTTTYSLKQTLDWLVSNFSKQQDSVNLTQVILWASLFDSNNTVPLKRNTLSLFVKMKARSYRFVVLGAAFWLHEIKKTSLKLPVLFIPAQLKTEGLQVTQTTNHTFCTVHYRDHFSNHTFLYTGSNMCKHLYLLFNNDS